MIPTRPEEEGSRHIVVGNRHLTGRTALVTGAGRGLGRAISRRLVELGAHVALGDNDAGALGQTANLLSDAAGTVTSHLFDVADAESVRAAVASIGRLEILVNNAGICPLTAPDQISEAEWDRVMAVNLKGAFNCTKVVSRQMIKKRYGKIINMASIVGIMGNAGQANYAASKGGLIALTKSLAKELASRNINVNAVAPGFIQTPMTDKLSEDQKKQMLEVIPLAKFGKPQDVAKVCLFLAGPDSDYMTGQVIVVDGGMTM